MWITQALGNRLLMAMQNPPNPGGTVGRPCLEPLGLTVTRAAGGLSVFRRALSELVKGRAGISVETAVRMSEAFVSTPKTWWSMQIAYDGWQAHDRAEDTAVERFAGE